MKNNKLLSLAVLWLLMLNCKPDICFSQEKNLKRFEISNSIGYGLTSVYNANINGDNEVTKYFGLGAVSFDVTASYYLTKNIGLHAGFGNSTYRQFMESKKTGIQSKYVYVDVDGDSYIPVFNTNYTVQQRLTYFNVPIGLSFKFNVKKFDFYIRSGLCIGFFMGGYEQATGTVENCGFYLDGLWAGELHCTEADYGFGTDNISEKYSYGSKDISSTNISVYIESGAVYKLSDKMGIGFGAFMNNGMIDISNDRSTYVNYAEEAKPYKQTVTSAYGGQLKLMFYF